MKLLGIVITTRRQREKELQVAEDRALFGMVDLLRKKDKIYLEPVTLVGDRQIVVDNVFLGPMAGPMLTVVSSFDGELKRKTADDCRPE